jgi:serine/threonine-protein kinase RIO1
LKNKVNAEKLLGSNYKIAKKGGDLAVSDKAYNSFNQSLKNSLKRSVVKGVERSGTGRAENISEKTRGGAMDSNVRLLITKAINNGLIQHCNGVVKEGKEAIVYHADAGTESEGFDVAVKVFKRISEFRNRGTYIDNDPRYFGQKFPNADSREQVELWAEKEYRNLVRANRAGISVPTPLLQRENVLFLRFLGDDGWPAPQLRELELRKGSKKWTTLYCQTLVAIRRLFHCARLIHGDLSEYNILVCSSEQVQNALDKSEDAKRDLQVVLIDFGQAVERNHPSALDLLKRDLQILNDFFLKQEITILEQEECEDFVTREFEGDSSNTEDEDNDLIVEDDTLDGWRHTPKDWNDQKNFEWVYDRLQQMNLVSR